MGAGGEGPVLQAGGHVPDELYCLTQDVSYSHRVNNPSAYDWCIVPDSSYDVVLFGGLAVVLACLLQGKLNTLMVLVAGAVIMAIAWPVNLGALGNSLAIWLGISPWQLFFYVFLPPLLLDAAVRIDWYLFRKSVVQVFTLAFLVVGATCVVMIPIMLYMLDLQKYGWNWIHACMFGAMIASTDAVAIVSIMKTSGGPRRLRVMLEGESLLNDASGLTLFEIFFHILEVSIEHPEESGSVGTVVGQVFLAVVQFGLIGFVMGMVFGVLTRLCLRFMRYLGASHDQEVALTLGMAYLAYWVTAQPCKGSGVVAVAVMGLYGAATNCWDMSTHAHSHFDGFWETLAFIVNSLVFLYSGASVVNFFIRASGDLTQFGTHANDLEVTLWMLPIIYIILCLVRFILTMAFRPLFIAIKGDMSLKECIFVCVAGLRGSASLIMGSAVVTHELHGAQESFSVVKAMMVFWTAGFVLLTLLINAPLLPTVLRLTGLSKVPDKQMARRQRAVAALAEHTATVLEQLRDAEDELLAGVDWAQVAAFVDHGRKYAQFTGHSKHRHSKWVRLRHKLQRWCCCCLPASWTGSRHRHSASHAGGKITSSGSVSPASDHSRSHRRRGSGYGSAVAVGGALKTITSDDLELAVGGSKPGDSNSNGVPAVEMSAAVNGATPDGVGAAQVSRLDGVPEHSANEFRRISSSRQRGRAPKKSRSSRYTAAKAKRPTSGTSSDDDNSRSGGGSSGSERSSSGSDSSGDDDGLIHSVLPGLGATEIDVLMQECPFMGSHYAAHQQRHGTAAADHPSSNLGPSSQRSSTNGGLVSRFWAPRSRKTLLPQSQQQLDLEQQQPLPPKTQPSVAPAAHEPSLPDSLPSAGPSAAASGRALDSGSVVPSAFAAVAASRSPASDADLSFNPSSRPKSPGAPGMRSLATRSAAPALLYGSSKAAEGPGAGSNERSGPHHARKGSTGATVDPSGSVTAGLSKPGSWGLAGMAMEASGSGCLGEVERSAGSPRATTRSSPFQMQTDKALGRQSGVFRGLATRSVNLSGASYGGGVADPGGQVLGMQPHLPEHAEAAMHHGHQGDYDAAAAAVDMVSLARSSKRPGQAPAAAAAGGPVGGSLARSGSRGLASRSVGMTGAYQSQHRRTPSASSGPNQQHSGSEGDLYGRSSTAGSYGDSAQQPAMRGLATRSQNPHLGPIAPVAPSLYTISTGLNAYAAATGASGGASDSYAKAREDNRGNAGAARSLGARSVPAAQAAAAMAAAAAAARGRAGLAAPSATGVLSFSDQLGSFGSSVGPAAAPAAAAAAAAAAAGANVSKSSGGLLDSVKRGLSKMSVSLAKGSKISRSAAGAEGESSEDESAYDSLYKSSTFAGSSAGERAANMEELADARHWLVSGLKRYFHSKRMEGLLSARGLRILDGSCEIALEDPNKPLALWYQINRDAGNNLLVRVITYMLFLLRQAAIWLVSMGAVGRWLAWPLRLIASMLQRPLNEVLLASVEVAMEYLMGLTTSPYVEWLQEGEVWTALLSEIQSESAQVAKFLIDREIEAPERYSAVQSYRVAMAVLRQQKMFVESLFESGMLDSTEHIALAHPIEAAERRLELLGPVWKAPSLREVLRQLPFMREQPEQVIGFLIKYGHLMMLSNGEQLPNDRDLYIVQAGIVKVTYQPDLGGIQEYFLGAGGVYNLYTALTGEHLPGTTHPVAQGNALGKGPVLFCVSAKGLTQLSAAAAAGDATFQQLELDMYRLAGLFLLERLKPQLDIEVSQALARMAPLYHPNTHRFSLDKLSAAAAAAGASSSSGHKPKRISRQQRAAWVRQHMTALKQHLKQELAKAELLLLPRGCSVTQESHVLLVQGSIQVKVADDRMMADQHTSETARWITNAGRHQHQSLLPWLWDIISDEDLQRAPAGVPSQPLLVSITAGPEGATLLICPSAADQSAAAAAGDFVSRGETLLLPAASAPPPATARLGSSALISNSSAAATGPDSIGPPNLARLSGGSGGAASAAAGPAAANRAAQLVSKQQQNPVLRRSLAAAAAADSIMSPRPGSSLRSTVGTMQTASAIKPGQSAAAAAGSSQQAGAADLIRISPTVRELGRISPLRLGSSNPLSGATVDNRQYVGADMRTGTVGNLNDTHATTAAAAAVDATATGETPSGTDRETHSGDDLPSAEAAAAAGAAPQPRRSRSQRPLRQWGSMRARDA